MKTEAGPTGQLEVIEDDTPRGILSKLKEHAAEARKHEREIEAKTDAGLAFLELGVKRVEDLRHTAITLAAVLLFAVILLAKC